MRRSRSLADTVVSVSTSSWLSVIGSIVRDTFHPAFFVNCVSDSCRPWGGYLEGSSDAEGELCRYLPGLYEALAIGAKDLRPPKSGSEPDVWLTLKASSSDARSLAIARGPE